MIRFDSIVIFYFRNFLLLPIIITKFKKEIDFLIIFRGRERSVTFPTALPHRPVAISLCLTIEDITLHMQRINRKLFNLVFLFCLKEAAISYNFFKTHT